MGGKCEDPESCLVLAIHPQSLYQNKHVQFVIVELLIAKVNREIKINDLQVGVWRLLIVHGRYMEAWGQGKMCSTSVHMGVYVICAVP